MKPPKYPRTPAFERLTSEEKWRAAEWHLQNGDKGRKAEVTEWLEKESTFWFIEACRESLEFDLTHNCKIIDHWDKSRSKPFIPNESQRQIWDYMVSCLERDVPCWMVIPKARRHGMTAVVGMFIHLWVTRGYARQALVVGHEKDDAETIFQEKYDYTQRHDPLSPETDRASVRELYYKGTTETPCNGRITVKSAKGLALGVGSASLAIHITEAGLLEDKASAKLYEAMAAIPQSGFSLVVIEGTGRGPQGPLFRYRNDALEDERLAAMGQPKTSPWRKFFLPWYSRPKQHVEVAFVGENHRRRVLENLTPYQQKVLEEVKKHFDEEAAERRIHWYVLERGRIHEPTDDLSDAKMRREHPTWEDECFEDSSDSAFNAVSLEKAMKTVPRVQWAGDILWPAWAATDALRVPFDTPMPEREWREKGPLSILREPVRGHEYVIGVDTAKGGANNDFQAAAVLDRHEQKFVAWYESRCSLDDFQPKVRMLSRLYEDAWLVIETNFDHLFVEQFKLMDREPFLYSREGPRDQMTEEPTKKYGFQTNNAGKNQLIRLAQRRLEKQPGTYTIPRGLEQMKLFRQDESPSGNTRFIGAPPGSGLNDDVAMAMFLALMGDHDLEAPEPLVSATPKPPPVDTRDRLTQYIESRKAMRAEEAERLSDGWHV